MHEKFLQKAIDIASENVNNNGGPYGAIIVKHAEIIAVSGNRVAADIDPTAHAEVMAIRLACLTLNEYSLSQCILYTSCEPCPMCLGAIYWARLEKVYYACQRLDAAKAGFDDSFIYDEISVQPEKRQIPMLHLELADSQNPFIAWKIQENKQLY